MSFSSRRQWRVLVLAVPVLLALPAMIGTGTTLLAADADPADIEFFEKRVRPVLVQSCLQCHSADKQRGGLRLDSRAAALKGGDTGPAFEPGDPDSSLLVEAVGYAGDIKMPPKGKLPAEQIAALAEWVKRGAPWPATDATGDKPDPKKVFDLAARRRDQWALQPLAKTSVPNVAKLDWARNDVDRFLLARLEQEKLAPAPAADKRTLLRRITFDLTGLPPTPAEIDAFLADESDRAYETVVERLLASPHYGERWARHWLDLVRFAETAGHEFDFEMPLAFEYRDYLIRALNADVPYDEFVLEHVAGDLLEKPRLHPTEGINESIIGTGFYFLGESKHSPVDIRADEAERIDNQIDVFAKTFLGMTLACARCHDHKFDAISTNDYYALAGFLQSSRYQEACVDAPAPRQRLVQQLEMLRDSELALWRETAGAEYRQDVKQLPQYLLASLAVLRPTPNDGLTPETDPLEYDPAEVVFEDFEKDTYGAWVATGEAFGVRPNRKPLPDYQGEVGPQGNGFVNTHSALNKDGQRTAGDPPTGTLGSPQFIVERPYIHFLIGGGAHVGKTCINLNVGGKTVRTATGRNENRMRWALWDVRELQGKTAVLEIVDRESGGWGNIGVDQILFSRDPIRGDTGARVAGAARKFKLEPARLSEWVIALQDLAVGDQPDLFRLWAELASRTDAVTPEGHTRWRDERLRALEAEAAAPPVDPQTTTVFERFDRPGFDGWFVTGDAFGSGPARTGQSVSPASIATLSDDGSAHSGALSPQLQGTLRSRTFTIEKPRIFYRMAGRGTKINLIIDGFQKIRNPIYGGLTIAPASPDKLQWQTQDVAKWVGHNAYIEILDEGTGVMEVDEIVFSDAGPPASLSNGLNATLLRESGGSPAQLAEGYAKLLELTLARWSANQPVSSAGEPDRTAALRWLLERDLPGTLRRAVRQAEPALQTKLATLSTQRGEAESQIRYSRKVMAMTDGTSEDERVHLRGSHKKLGDVVPRRFLEAIAGPQQPPLTTGSGRLELARRMIDSSDPLLRRVLVNRLWKHHFGEGLVRSIDDFGNMGQAPTHPELLDYLAAEFVRGGWSIKHMHRLLVLSNTYRMSSRPDDAHAEEIDPQNKLLHRMPLRRLEAEAIRDAVLSVSGRLDDKLFGPSVLPYLTEFTIGRGRPAPGPLDGGGRRSIYINVRRNFLTPFFLAFDYPIPFSTMGRRGVSNVPAQALAMMNNPFIAQQADLWAQRVAAEKTDRAARIQGMYVSAFGRPPAPEELEAATAFIDEQLRSVATGDEVRAWSSLAHVLFNVKEFIFIN